MPEPMVDAVTPRTRRRIPVAEVVALIAIGLSLIGGGAVASHLVVRTSDLAPNAVDTTKVDNGSLGGGDVKESSLATVPSTAKVGTSSAKRFRKVTPVTGVTTLATLGGLRLTYECVPSGFSPTPSIDARSTVDNATITLAFVQGPQGSGEVYFDTIFDLDRGESLPVDDGTGASAVRISYRAPNGSTVSGSLDHGNTPTMCIAQGVLVGG